jgi:hypothetical protein
MRLVARFGASNDIATDNILASNIHIAQFTIGSGLREAFRKTRGFQHAATSIGLIPNALHLPFSIACA